MAVHGVALEHRHRGDGIDIVTISGGIACCADAARPEALVKSADAALYRAKGAGRDRLCLFDVASPEAAVPVMEAEIARAVDQLQEVAALGKRGVALRA